MAKQIGDIRITGTVAGVTFYKMDGQYYARRKSSLEGKRVKRDPRFRRTMEWAQRLARGSQLASRVYRSLPRHQQAYALFCTLKSTAIRALKEGRSEEDVLALLHACLAARLQTTGTVPAVPITREAPRDQRPPAPTGPAQKAGPTGQPHLFVDADGKLQATSPGHGYLPWTMDYGPSTMDHGPSTINLSQYIYNFSKPHHKPQPA